MAIKKIKDADLINNPTHYNTGDIECIDAIQSSGKLDENTEKLLIKVIDDYKKGNK